MWGRGGDVKVNNPPHSHSLHSLVDLLCRGFFTVCSDLAQPSLTGYVNLQSRLERYQP